jgi:hypothetical protein
MKEDTRLMKLIRRLDSPENEHEAASALRMLASELQARGRSFQKLADLTAQWDQEDATAQPKAKPFEWSKIESAVTLYTQDKNKITMNKLLRAIKEMVKETPPDMMVEYRYITARLRNLGFHPSQSLLTWTR